MIELPAALMQAFDEALQRAGDAGPFSVLKSVGGGSINQAVTIQSALGQYFMKWNEDPLPGMFAREAEGLQLLQTTGAVRVPQVITQREARDDVPAFLVLEWIGSSSSFDQRMLGEQLAALHLMGQETRYGLENDNYIGSSDQFNEWEEDWVEFFRTRRLYPQYELAIGNGRLPKQRRQKLETLIEQLDKWLAGVPRKPSLLHGDLWIGNVIPDEDAHPVLIDPAVYWGDREAELAFTNLFGGFTDAFYQAYQAVYPLEPGYLNRFKIYNLYHLLNHLNLFGESYGSDVDAILKHFVG
jgi:fructosamine-3-kinase